MWLSGLHIPESYLTALVQATCRKNGWPLDKSTLYTTVTEYAEADDVTERAHQGIIRRRFHKLNSEPIKNSFIKNLNPES